MKKFAFLMMGLIAAFTMTACIDSDSDSDMYEAADFGNVTGLAPLTISTDTFGTLYVADTDAAIADYKDYEYGDRLLLYFKQLVAAETGQKTNQIKLYGFIKFGGGQTATLTEGEVNNYGKLDIDISRSGTYYDLVHLTKSVLDLQVMIKGTKIEGHEVTLVLDETDPTTEDGYLKLQLCHSAPESESSATKFGYMYYTFDMVEFMPYMDGTKGVQFTAVGLNSKDPVEHKFEWPKK